MLPTSPNPPPIPQHLLLPVLGTGEQTCPSRGAAPAGLEGSSDGLRGIGSRMRPAAPFGLCLAYRGKPQAGQPSIAVPCRDGRCPVRKGASGHLRDLVGGVCSGSSLPSSGSSGAVGRGPSMATHPPAPAPHQAVAGRQHNLHLNGDI